MTTTTTNQNGHAFTLEMDPHDYAGWLTVGKVSLRITLSHEGSVSVVAYAVDHEADDELDHLYVSWRDLD